MASPKKLVAITDMRAKSKSLDDSQARDATPTAFSGAKINFGVKPNGAECKTGANNWQLFSSPRRRSIVERARLAASWR